MLSQSGLVIRAFAYELPRDIGEPEIAAHMAISEAIVIQGQTMKIVALKIVKLTGFGLHSSEYEVLQWYPRFVPHLEPYRETTR